jgi:DNA-binding response OmpR family regulator
MTYRILSVGPFSEILSTRNAVLRQAGFLVQSSVDLNEALRLLLQDDFDGAILCHSIPRRDKERLIHLLKEHKPLTPVAVMTDGYRVPEADLEIHSLDGPEELIRRLGQLVEESGRGRRTS